MRGIRSESRAGSDRNDARDHVGIPARDRRNPQFEPYQERSAARAREIDPKPHQCGACGAKAYLRDGDTCIACGYSSDETFLRCPSCSNRAVFYDYLNLEFNDWLKARCGQCRWGGKAVQCSRCGDDYLIEEDEPLTCPYCQDS